MHMKFKAKVYCSVVENGKGLRMNKALLLCQHFDPCGWELTTIMSVNNDHHL